MVALSIAAPPTAGAEPPRATLYAFFATWCVPCRVELPHVQRFATTYADRGLEVVLVSEDAPSTAANIPAFLARHGVSARWILDRDSELLERYNSAATLPFTVLLDADGAVAYAHPGYEPGDEEQLEAAITRVLAGPVATESASPVQVRVSSQLLGVYRESRFDPIPDNDGLLQSGVARLEASVYTESYAALARVDGAVVDDEVSADDRDARLERIKISDAYGPVRLTAGDDYVSFGSGLSLSLRRVDQLGVDTSVRGGRAQYDAGRFAVDAVVGLTNAQNLDPLELRVVDFDGDLIGGLEVGFDVSSELRVAPYALVVRADGAGGGGEDARWTIAGAELSLERGPLRLRAEAAGGRRRGIGLDDDTPLALYASGQLTRDSDAVVVELKAYRDWEIGRGQDSLLYHEPPTLEREDQEVPANDNAVGARVRYQRDLFGGLSGTASGLYYRYSDDGTSALSGSHAAHVYAGVDGRRGRSSYSAAAGYRLELEDDADFKLSLWHIDGDFAAPMARWRERDIAVTLKWNHREETKELFNRFSFRRGLGVLGVSLAGVGSLSALYGYSTERRDGTAPTHYPGAELAVQLPRGGRLRLFVGRLTGGRVCVSGSCRDVPPFEGGRADIVLRY